MNREALSKRLEGLSSVFAEDTKIAKDLKAMSYVLANMPEDKFTKILNADYDADEVEAQGGPGFGRMFTPQSPGRYVPMRQRTREPGAGKKDIFYIEDIIKSKIPDAQKVEKIKGILSPEPTPAEKPEAQQAKTAEEDKEGMFPVMRRRMGPGGHVPDGTGPYGRGMGPGAGRGDGTGLGDNILTIILAPDADDGEKLQKIKGLVSPQEEEGMEEETACRYAKEDKVEGGYWNKQASAAVLNNLVRDVTGMEKIIPYNTKRQLTPDQTPDGKHDEVPETPASLKEKQTPDQTDVIDSDIYDKSKVDKVRKEAGSKRGPGVPDATGPYSGTEECQMSDKKKKKKVDEEDSETESNRQPQEEGNEVEEERKKEKKDEKEAGKGWDPGAGQNAPKGDMNNPNRPAEEILKGKDKTSGLKEMKKQKAEKAEEKAEDLEEKAKKDITKAQKSLEKAKDIEEEAEDVKPKDAGQTTYLVDGIELVASMEEVDLDQKEANKLNELYK